MTDTPSPPAHHPSLSPSELATLRFLAGHTSRLEADSDQFRRAVASLRTRGLVGEGSPLSLSPSAYTALAMTAARVR